MPVSIDSLRLGINRCYVIRDEGAIMIDAGPPRRIRTIEKFFAEIKLEPHQLQLLVLTHGDFDHVGSAEDIRKLTGAKIAIHEDDRILLEEARFSFPGAKTLWGHVTRSLLMPFLPYLMKFSPTKADVVLTGEDFSLKPFSVNGRIIYTPGHTSGSLTVLLDSGEAFVGCLAHNNFPFRLKPGLPIFAGDIEKVKRSWKLLIAQGARVAYPGHGDPFPVEVMKDLLKI
jgi:hydroxyacylglutathione hydrolase